MMKRMKKVFCALLAMVLVAGVCVIPTEAVDGGDLNVEYTVDADSYILVGTEITFTAKIINNTTSVINDVFAEMGYSLDSRNWFDSSYEEQVNVFTEVLVGENYVTQGNGAHIDSLEAGQTVEVVFKGKMPEETLGYEVVFLHRLSIGEEGARRELSVNSIYATGYQTQTNPMEPSNENDHRKLLQARIDAAQNEQTVDLIQDYTWWDGEPIVISSGKNIVLNMNGYNIESLEDLPVFKIESGAQLKLVKWTSLGGDSSEVKQAVAHEGWEEHYEEEWLGLFEVEEGGKLILAPASRIFFTAGYNMFTSDSAGEIIVDGGYYNMIPNGNYQAKKWYQFVETYIQDDIWDVDSEGRFWWEQEQVLDVDCNHFGNVPVGQPINFEVAIKNKADYAIENVEVKMGYYLSYDDYMADYGTRDKMIIFTEVIPADKYKTNNGKVTVPKIEAGETIKIKIVGNISEELANKEVIMSVRVGIIEDSVDTYDSGLTMHGQKGYLVKVDTKDPVVKEDISKPVEDVTVVESTETETAVITETVKVVGDILNRHVSEEVVSSETATKVRDAVESGKSVTAEIVVKEMSTEEIEQITDTDKKAIEDKVATELGEDANLQYLDLSIMLKADDEELGTLNKLEEEITITVAIPEDLKADGRTYKVIRNHNGVVEVLDTVVNEDGTISFKTDRFSTYAIAYADKEETNTNPNPGTPSTDNNKDTNTNTNTNTNQSNKTPSTDSKAPQTGDNNSVLIYVAICFVALAAIVVTKRRKVFAK